MMKSYAKKLETIRASSLSETFARETNKHHTNAQLNSLSPLNSPHAINQIDLKIHRKRSSSSKRSGSRPKKTERP